MNNLDFAIQMELDGEKYYQEQAQISEANRLNIVFLQLAEDEKRHAEILKRKASGLPYELNGPAMTSTNVFSGLVDFKNEIKQVPAQLDVYRMALEMEKKSIELYQELMAEGGADKELFAYLINQEEKHFEIIDELVKLVNRPNEWVEAAEFGLREKY